MTCRWVGESRTRRNDLWRSTILESHFTDHTNPSFEGPIPIDVEVPRLLERGCAGRESLIKVTDDLVVVIVQIDDRRGIGSLDQASVGCTS